MKTLGIILLGICGMLLFPGCNEDDPIIPKPQKVNSPEFKPEAGEYQSAQNVVISTETNGATIYYTMDGSDPDSTSIIFSKPILVDDEMTIKAFAWKEGMLNSQIVNASYTINYPVVAAPTFNYDGGTYHSYLTIDISCDTEGATIYYSIDGKDPLTDKIEFAGPVNIHTTTTIKVIAVKEGLLDSKIVENEYILDAYKTGNTLFYFYYDLGKDTDYLPGYASWETKHFAIFTYEPVGQIFTEVDRYTSESWSSIQVRPVTRYGRVFLRSRSSGGASLREIDPMNTGNEMFSFSLSQLHIINWNSASNIEGWAIIGDKLYYKQEFYMELNWQTLGYTKKGLKLKVMDLNDGSKQTLMAKDDEGNEGAYYLHTDGTHLYSYTYETNDFQITVHRRNLSTGQIEEEILNYTSPESYEVWNLTFSGTTIFYTVDLGSTIELRKIGFGDSMPTTIFSYATDEDNFPFDVEDGVVVMCFGSGKTVMYDDNSATVTDLGPNMEFSLLQVYNIK